MSFVYFLGAQRPSTQVPTDRVCAWCLCEKDFLKTGWLLCDPFMRHHPADCGCALIPSISTADCRYCPMHGCTLMLCGALQALRSIAPYGTHRRFETLIRQIKPNWGEDVTLRCVEMKAILDSTNIVRNIAQLFPNQGITLRTPNGPDRVLQQCDAVLMLLDSIRFYKEFACCPKPLPQDFVTLTKARNCYLAFYFANGWQIDPTPHYMTNEFLHYVELDGSAYYALQEGTEHKHADDRVDVHSTMKRSSSKGGDGRGGYQQLLDQQETRRQLVRLGYGRQEDLPERVRQQVVPVQLMPIPPPRFCY